VKNLYSKNLIEKNGNKRGKKSSQKIVQKRWKGVQRPSLKTVLNKLGESVFGDCGTDHAAALVQDLLVQTNVQVVAALVGQTQPDGNVLRTGRHPDVDLQLSLQHPEFPQPWPVPHHH
jgi:hypothetical protein